MWQERGRNIRHEADDSENSDEDERDDNGAQDVLRAVAGVAGIAAVALASYGAYRGIRYILRSFSPARIRFSQDSIGRTFRDDKDVNLAILKIAAGKASASDFPRIEVVKKRDGALVSSDNRRLYVFRVLHLLGKLSTIEVNFTDDMRHAETTRNAGCHLRMRRGTTYQHCACHGQYGVLPGWWNGRSVVFHALSPEERAALEQENEEQCSVM